MTVLAADIGGTKVAVARVDEEGAVVGPVLTAPTPAHADGRAVVDLVASLLREARTPDVTAVGVAAAGVIDTDAGTVTHATSSIAGWAGTALGPELASRTGLPVTVVGDGHAFGLGETRLGAARGHGSALVLVAGTGIGGSFVDRGRVLFGARWSGGHFGHLAVPGADGVPCPCGATGHLEAIAGGPGVVGQYHRLGGDPSVTRVEDLPDDDAARQAVEAGGAAIGTVAGGLANAFDPGIVVIAGGLTKLGPVWETALRRRFEANLMGALSGVPLVVSDADAWFSLRGAALATRGLIR